MTKAEIRRIGRAARAALPFTERVSGSQRAASLWPSNSEVPTGLKIGGYYPIHKELDPLPLLASLAARGAVNSLPVMQGEGEPLLFRVWTEGDPTEAGPFGVRQPPAGAALIEPDLILAPMVAFDMSGARVGYGGGYYDKTIAKARASRSVTVVGLAFSAQMVNHIPKQAYDQPMDWIVTELAAHQIKPA